MQISTSAVKHVFDHCAERSPLETSIVKSETKGQIGAFDVRCLEQARGWHPLGLVLRDRFNHVLVAATSGLFWRQVIVSYLSLFSLKSHLSILTLAGFELIYHRWFLFR